MGVGKQNKINKIKIKIIRGTIGASPRVELLLFFLLYCSFTTKNHLLVSESTAIMKFDKGCGCFSLRRYAYGESCADEPW